MTMASCYHAVCEQYICAVGDTMLYAVQGLLNTVSITVMSILFLTVFNLGITGYVLSVALADLFCTEYLILKNIYGD